MDEKRDIDRVIAAVENTRLEVMRHVLPLTRDDVLRVLVQQLREARNK